jgi:hypothetical protein
MALRPDQPDRQCPAAGVVGQNDQERMDTEPPAWLSARPGFDVRDAYSRHDTGTCDGERTCRPPPGAGDRGEQRDPAGERLGCKAIIGPRLRLSGMQLVPAGAASQSSPPAAGKPAVIPGKLTGNDLADQPHESSCMATRHLSYLPIN